MYTLAHKKIHKDVCPHSLCIHIKYRNINFPGNKGRWQMQ